MWLAALLGVGTIIEPKAEPIIEAKAGPLMKPGMGLATEPRVRPVTEPKAKLVDIKKLLIFIAFITIINISTSKLHNLIKSYSDKK